MLISAVAVLLLEHSSPCFTSSALVPRRQTWLDRPDLVRFCGRPKRNGQAPSRRPAATQVIDSKNERPKGVSHLVRTAASVGLTLIALGFVTTQFEVLAHSCSHLLEGSGVLVATAAGGAAGALHTLAGPDHLAALAPLVTGGRRTSATAFFLGALWGSGHAAGQVLLGLAALLARAGFFASVGWAVKAEAVLRRFGGALVGVALIFIGAVGFREVREAKMAASRGEDVVAENARSRYGWATFVTGVMHGLQPDALLFIMPALALPARAAIGFVVAFGVGTLLSMGACAVVLAWFCSNNSSRVELISTTASYVAVLLGAAILLATFGIEIPVLGGR